MLPLKDLNPTRRTPVITYALIVINVLVFIWEQTIPLNELEGIFMRLSVVPTFVTWEGSSQFSLRSSSTPTLLSR